MPLDPYDPPACLANEEPLVDLDTLGTSGQTAVATVRADGEGES